MLDHDTKQTIQTAYSRFLEQKNLKPRHGQKLMIAAVARTLGNVASDDDGQRVGEEHVCVVEAGTGTGKTVAYALAAIPAAQAQGKKLVISTATVALQEQIVLKDLPDLRKHSGLVFSHTLAKGRGRYACLYKLDFLLAHGGEPETQALYPDERDALLPERTLRLFQILLDALSDSSWDGDRDNWSQAIDNEDWQRLTTDHNQCTGRRCAYVTQCPFFQARENLIDADVIVANHDLVLADLALGGGDDYLLAFTVDASRLEALRDPVASLGLDLHEIGVVVAGSGVSVTTREGGEYRPTRTGFNHFGSDDGE